MERETRDAQAVGGMENKTTAMSTPSIPLGKLLTFTNTAHADTFRNRYMVTISGLIQEEDDSDRAAALVMKTEFLKPFVSKK